MIRFFQTLLGHPSKSPNFIVSSALLGSLFGFRSEFSHGKKGDTTGPIVTAPSSTPSFRHNRGSISEASDKSGLSASRDTTEYSFPRIECSEIERLCTDFALYFEYRARVEVAIPQHLKALVSSCPFQPDLKRSPSTRLLERPDGALRLFGLLTTAVWQGIGNALTRDRPHLRTLYNFSREYKLDNLGVPFVLAAAAHLYGVF